MFHIHPLSRRLREKILTPRRCVKKGFRSFNQIQCAPLVRKSAECERKTTCLFLWLSEIFKFFYVECFFQVSRLTHARFWAKYSVQKYFLRTKYFEGQCTSKLTILHSLIEYNMDEIRWRSQAMKYSEQREGKCFEEIDRWCSLRVFLRCSLVSTAPWSDIFLRTLELGICDGVTIHF